MKKFINSRRAWLVLAAVVLILSASVVSAIAYFTDYTTVSGGMFLELDWNTNITEEPVVAGKKQVSVINTGEVDVYVRSKAFSGTEYPLEYNCGNDWYDGGDGWYYYNKILAVGERTPILEVFIKDIKESEADQFSVVVVQESVPVRYVNDAPLPADWNQRVSAGGAA